jgi:hypothetical protein
MTPKMTIKRAFAPMPTAGATGRDDGNKILARLQVPWITHLQAGRLDAVMPGRRATALSISSSPTVHGGRSRSSSRTRRATALFDAGLGPLHKPRAPDRVATGRHGFPQGRIVCQEAGGRARRTGR